MTARVDTSKSRVGARVDTSKRENDSCTPEERTEKIGC